MKKEIIAAVISCIVTLIFGWFVFGTNIVITVIKQLSIAQISKDVFDRIEIISVSNQGFNNADAECPADTKFLSGSCTGILGNGHPEPAGGPLFTNTNKVLCNSAISPMNIKATAYCARLKS